MDITRISELEQEMGDTFRDVLNAQPASPTPPKLGLLGKMIAKSIDSTIGYPTSPLIHLGMLRTKGAFAGGVDRAAEQNAKRLAPTLFDQNPEMALNTIEDVAAFRDFLKQRRMSFRRRGGLFGGLAAPSAVNALSFD